MPSISGTKTDNTVSAEYTPSENAMDIIITQRGSGIVNLQSKPPGGIWGPVGPVLGHKTVPTPDNGILYRLYASGNDIDYDYYCGP